MHRWLALVLAGVVLLVGGTPTWAASATPAPTGATPATPAGSRARFSVEGKVVGVHKGWVEVSVTKVGTGSGLAAGATVKIVETRRTRILRDGKVVGQAALKPGASVRVEGEAATSKGATAYRAARIVVLH